MRFAELDAVTIDGFGTLLELESPFERLDAALEARDVHRSRAAVEEAFAAEAAYYKAHAHLAPDEDSLRRLREDCARVFLDELAAPLDPAEFAEPYIEALVFRPAPGAPEAIATLRSRGLRLAVASNWDCSLPGHLRDLGLLEHFDVVVTSAAAGAPKPEPRMLELALEKLGVAPDRALHVGDEEVDELAAAAAGTHFAPAPLAAAVATLE
ncbi:MAG TPA: HAD family hydrolase [Gaiellaceae bacterium]|nr:HAD family hydrolase [Gaiellaceae bacterium]